MISKSTEKRVYSLGQMPKTGTCSIPSSLIASDLRFPPGTKILIAEVVGDDIVFSVRHPDIMENDVVRCEVRATQSVWVKQC